MEQTEIRRMGMKRNWGSTLAGAILLGIFLGIVLAMLPGRVFAQTPVNADGVRNGDFAQFATRRVIDGWRSDSSRVAIAETGDAEGGPAVQLDPEREAVAWLYQEIHLPTTVVSATLAFDFRIIYRFETPSPGTIVNGVVAVVPMNGATPDLQQPLFAYNFLAAPALEPTDWLNIVLPLDEADIKALNQARTNQQRLALYFEGQSGTLNDTLALDLSLLLDNVALQIGGTQSLPALDGEIVYIDGAQIRRIGPAGGTPQTVWTHPAPENGEVAGVRWNPAATEIAFISDHEQFYSRFVADLYGVRIDGSGLRRITNAPAQSELAAGDFARGDVQLTILNNYADATDPVTSFAVYVRGAEEISLQPLPTYGESIQVVLEDVAQLEGDNQPIILFYTSAKCGTNRRDVPGFVTVVPNATVELDVSFNATDCGGFQARVLDLSWNREGDALGFVLTGAAQRVASAGSTGPGQEWFSLASFTSVADWSPVDDRVVFDLGNLGIGIRNLTGGDASILLVPENSATPEKPAWLPDGTGLLYIQNGDLYFASSQGQNQDIERLTFFEFAERVNWAKPSPDGEFVVLERQVGDTSTLWILERANPVNTWSIATGSLPHWSRITPTLPDPGTDPDDPDDPDDPESPSNTLYIPAIVR